MSGNRAGGLKAAEKNIKHFGKDFYKNIGKMGGAKSRNGGFASDKIGPDGLTGAERARIAGRKGGSKSRRTSKKIVVEE